jgi:hypothetical protein
MKKMYTLLVFIITLTISAQAPQGFNYQATVRNNAGALMINKNVTFKFNVMKDTPTSVPVFSETHYVPTDDLGAVNLVIGKGTATTGTFTTIDWGTGTYYLGIELNTGNGFVAMGTSQLLSVPYALYASNSGNGTSIGTISNTSNPKGATITSGVLSLTPADATNGGILTTGNQTIAGAKTFSSDITINGIIGGRGNGNIETNTTFGNQALINNTTGSTNTAIGYKSLFINTTGEGNTANGVSSLTSNNTGNENTAMGYQSLYSNINGNTNTAIGLQSLKNNTTGSNNTALGMQSLLTNTIGNYNTAIGKLADVTNNNLTNTTAIGYNAKVSTSNTIQLGDTNITDVKTAGTVTARAFVGDGSQLTNIGSGTITADVNRNIAIGTKLETVDITTTPASGDVGEYIPFTHTPSTSSYGKDNLSISIDGLKKLTIGRGNIAIGSGSLKENTNAAENTAVGYYALSEDVSNGLNTAFGSYALMKNTDWANTAIGHNALTGHVYGWMNVAMGNGAMQLSLDRNSNTAIGGDALRNGQYGDLNTAVGIEALMNNGVGLNSNSSTNGTNDGTHNTGVGAFAMKFNTLGQNNSGLGFNVLRLNTTGLSNTAVGADASKNNTTGSNNTSLGAFSSQNNITGNGNTIIGTFADVATGNINNAIAIGNNAVVSASNTIQLGNGGVTDVKTAGRVTASGFKTPTGTASQYLMADGTVRNSSGNALTLLGKIIYSKYINNNGIVIIWEIWMANYDGTNNAKINITLPTNVYIGSVDNSDGNPKMSPDGAKLFFEAFNIVTSAHYIYSCNPDGSNPTKLIETTLNNPLSLNGVN